MYAMRYTRYGSPDVLTRDRVETPPLGATDVLIQVHAAAANAGDWHLLRGAPFIVRLSSGLRRPKHQILGSDVAGQIVAVGSGVTQFQPGDAVFGDLSESGFGAFAEYVVAPTHALALKPMGLSFAQAAAVPSAALTALQGLRDEAGLQVGQQVLINGASGGVGTFAVQIAKALGATVTAVCSTRNLELMHTLGVEHVIDYTQEDYTRQGRHYDVIFDLAAFRPFGDNQRALVPGGVYVLGGGSGGMFLSVMLTGPWRSWRSGQRFSTFVKRPTPERLRYIRAMLENGTIVPVIDRCYPLDQLPDALHYLETGRARGKVVINVERADR